MVVTRAINHSICWLGLSLTHPGPQSLWDSVPASLNDYSWILTVKDEVAATHGAVCGTMWGRTGKHFHVIVKVQESARSESFSITMLYMHIHT